MVAVGMRTIGVTIGVGFDICIISIFGTTEFIAACIIAVTVTGSSVASGGRAPGRLPSSDARLRGIA